MTETKGATPPASFLAKLTLGIFARPLGGHIVLNFYERMRKERLYNKDFWDAAVKELDVEYVFDEKYLNQIPKSGPVILIANHHLGILDSLGMTHLLSKVRSDFKMMAIDKIKDASVIQGIQSQLIFVADKSSPHIPSPKEEALKHLKQGGSLILFPSGFLAIPEKQNEFAFDPIWKSGTITLAESSNAAIVPLYFHSQNSAFYRKMTKVIPALKHTTLVTEAVKKRGQQISVTIGAPLKVTDIPGEDVRVKANALRSLVYSLGLQEILNNLDTNETTNETIQLIKEHKKTISQFLPEGMHLQIPQYVNSLFYKNI